MSDRLGTTVSTVSRYYSSTLSVDIANTYLSRNLYLLICPLLARCSPFIPLWNATVCEQVTHIYLEKPGAPDLATLNAMAAAAVSHLVPVCMGYNKNMAPYVARMIQFEKQISPRACSVTFAHCDDWSNTDFLERTRGDHL